MSFIKDLCDTLTNQNTVTKNVEKDEEKKPWHSLFVSIEIDYQFVELNKYKSRDTRSVMPAKTSLIIIIRLFTVRFYKKNLLYKYNRIFFYVCASANLLSVFSIGKN